METGKYADFPDINVVHTLKPTDSGVAEFKTITLDHAVAGDTDSVYLSFSKKAITAADENPDILSELADEVALSVNEAYPEFLKQAFNCPSERLNSMKSVREVVAKSAFFASKKRYAMHVVNDEGKRVDKVKIQGLEIKKSDTSKAVKVFLREIVDIILSGSGSREEINSYKRDFKERFYKMTWSEIGIPKPTTTLNKNKVTYELTGSFKGITSHAAGAIFYNSMCTTADREIRVGEKFYWVYIKGAKCKSIGVPVETTKLPKFLDDIHIDYDLMWEKAESKAIKYMAAIGWDLSGQVKTNSLDLFGV